MTLEAWSPWEGTPIDFEQRLGALRSVHPHLTVTWTGIGFGRFLDKVTAAVAGDTPPDLVYLDNQHQGFFGRAGLLVDQGPLGKRDRDFSVEAIEPRALDLYTYDGLVLGYPWALTTGQVFFNRDLFRAAGRTTPDELVTERAAGRGTPMTEAAVGAHPARGGGEVEQLGHRPAVDLAPGPEQQRHRPVRRLPPAQEVPPGRAGGDRGPGVPRRTWRTSTARAGTQTEAADLGGNDNKAYEPGQVAMLVSLGRAFAGNARTPGVGQLGRALPQGPGRRGARRSPT